jgi:hypothetical protein
VDGLTWQGNAAELEDRLKVKSADVSSWRKRSPDAGDGRGADHFQPSLLSAAELDPIADAGADDRGESYGPILLQKSKIVGDRRSLYSQSRYQGRQ